MFFWAAATYHINVIRRFDVSYKLASELFITATKSRHLMSWIWFSRKYLPSSLNVMGFLLMLAERKGDINILEWLVSSHILYPFDIDFFRREYLSLMIIEAGRGVIDWLLDQNREIADNCKEIVKQFFMFKHSLCTCTRTCMQMKK